MPVDAIRLSARQLRRRYIVALTLIAALTLAAQVLVQFLIASQAHDSRLVNIAGRQRMLSQKITKLSYYVASSASTDEANRYRDELRDALDLWQRSHAGLQYGDDAQGLPGRNSPEILALFAGIEPRFEAIVAAGRELLTAPRNSPALDADVARIRANEGDFLRGMDAIVFRYDEEAKSKVENARQLEIGLAIVTLLVLALEAALIFAPATRRIEHDMRELSNRERDMEQLFAVSPTALLLADRQDLSIVHANQKAAILIGAPLAALAGSNLTDYVDGNHGINRLFLDKIVTGETLNEYEIIILDAQRTVIEALVSVRTINFSGREVLVLGLTDITELKKAQQALEHHATFDEMTGMMNRRTGLMLLEKSMARSRRDGGPLVVCYLDVDGLKTVNDRRGHAAGDWLIRTVAWTIKDAVRGGDSAVRLGGDEMLLVLHDCTEAEADALIDRVQTRLREVEAAEDKGIPLSISHGSLRYAPDRHGSADELVSEADLRMYQAKERRKGTAGARS